MRLHHLFDDPTVKQVIAAAEDNAIERINRLSPREREVLVAVVNGRLNKQAAHDMGISVRTLENHRLRLMEKTGVKTFAQLVRLTIIAGL